MIKLIFFLLTLFLGFQNLAISQETPQPLNPVKVSMIASNSVGKISPFEVFSADATPWEPNPSDQFVKLHVYLDKPIPLSGFEVKPCPQMTSHTTITYYLNFDEMSDVMEDTSWRLDFYSPVMTRSLTLNFNQNKNACVSELILYGNNKQKLSVMIPVMVKGSIVASSILSPQPSYDPANLFDSRFEYGWSSNGKSKGESLTIQFEEEQTITKLLVWNGYQRSDVHCYANGRLKTITVEGDGNYQATVQVADVMGSQEIVLPIPFKGKNLKLVVQDSFAGKKYPDLVVSELRFGNDTQWMTLDYRPFLEKIAMENIAQFQKANLAEILGHSFRGYPFGQVSYDDWTFRFRSDGSFYIEGSASDEKKGEKEKFYALGNYEIKNITPTGVNLRIFGFLRKAKYPWGGDCNGCGRDCNQKQNPDEQQKIFQDFVTLSKKEGRIIIKNTGSVKNLKFFNELTLSSQEGDDW